MKDFKELGKKTYEEYRQAEGYGEGKQEILTATDEQLKDFKQGFIEARKVREADSDIGNMESFWAMLDEMGIAIDKRMKVFE